MTDTDQQTVPVGTITPSRQPQPQPRAAAFATRVVAIQADPAESDAAAGPSAAPAGSQSHARGSGGKPVQKHDAGDDAASTTAGATAPVGGPLAAPPAPVALPVAQDGKQAIGNAGDDLGGPGRVGTQGHAADEPVSAPASHPTAHEPARQDVDSTDRAADANATATGRQSAAGSDPAAPSFTQMVATSQPDASVAAALAASASASASEVGASPAMISGQSLSTTQAGETPGAAIGATGVSDASAQLVEPLVTLASATDGSSRLQVSLQPKDLGEVKIYLDRGAEGSVRITVTASEPSTLRSLIADQAHLHAALDAAAIPAADRQFSFELSSQNQGGGQSALSGDTGAGTAQGGMQQSGGGMDKRGGREAGDGTTGPWSAGAAPAEDATTVPAFMAARTGSYRNAINITA